MPLSGKINWTVSSETLASVKGGTVKALAEGTGKLSGSYQGKGTVVIKAVCEGKSVSVRVTVK